jgi:hypothetical protein
MSAFVLSKDGSPLMPTRCGYAKDLIRKGKAVCKYSYPFTIRLNYETSERTVKTTLGIDPGYSCIGFSVVTDKKELIAGTLYQEGSGSKQPNPTKRRLEDRRMYRKNRRSRLRYRPARWLNRANAKKEGWLPPSINRKMITHLNLVTLLKKFVPINDIIVELNTFDVAKLDNPDIEGVGYQQGKLFQLNMREYLFAQQNGVCLFCKKMFSTKISNIHHIKPRKSGGANTADNLVLIHEDCHKKLDHDNWRKYEKMFGKTGLQPKHKQDTFMNIVRKRLVKELNAKVTFGYVTKYNRRLQGLQKTHYNDAFVMAGGVGQLRSDVITITQKHKNNRQLQWLRPGKYPGFRIRKNRDKFQSGDIVYIGKNRYVCGGTTNGRVVTGSKKSKSGYWQAITVPPEKITKHIMFGTLKIKEEKKMGLPKY